MMIRFLLGIVAILAIVFVFTPNVFAETIVIDSDRVFSTFDIRQGEYYRINSGVTVTITDHATIAGTLENNGVFKIDGGYIAVLGPIDGKPDGIVINNGIIHNVGDFKNNGQITNNGFFKNFSQFTNYNKFINKRQIDNQNYFVNDIGGTFQNLGVVNPYNSIINKNIVVPQITFSKTSYYYNELISVTVYNPDRKSFEGGLSACAFTYGLPQPVFNSADTGEYGKWIHEFYLSDRFGNELHDKLTCRVSYKDVSGNILWSEKTVQIILPSSGSTSTLPRTTIDQSRTDTSSSTNEENVCNSAGIPTSGNSGQVIWGIKPGDKVTWGLGPIIPNPTRHVEHVTWEIMQISPDNSSVLIKQTNDLHPGYQGNSLTPILHKVTCSWKSVQSNGALTVKSSDLLNPPKDPIYPGIYPVYYRGLDLPLLLAVSTSTEKGIKEISSLGSLYRINLDSQKASTTTVFGGYVDTALYTGPVTYNFRGNSYFADLFVEKYGVTKELHETGEFYSEALREWINRDGGWKVIDNNIANRALPSIPPVQFTGTQSSDTNNSNQNNSPSVTSSTPRSDQYASHDFYIQLDKRQYSKEDKIHYSITGLESGKQVKLEIIKPNGEKLFHSESINHYSDEIPLYSFTQSGVYHLLASSGSFFRSVQFTYDAGSSILQPENSKFAFSNLHMINESGMTSNIIQRGKSFQIIADVHNTNISEQQFYFVLSTNNVVDDNDVVSSILQPREFYQAIAYKKINSLGTYHLTGYLLKSLSGNYDSDISDPKNYLASPLSLSITVKEGTGQRESSQTNLIVNTDKTQYNIGDILSIHGKINQNFNKQKPLNIQIISSTGNIVSIGQTLPKSDGSIMWSKKISGPMWTDGKYQILLMYEDSSKNRLTERIEFSLILKNTLSSPENKIKNPIISSDSVNISSNIKNTICDWNSGTITYDQMIRELESYGWNIDDALSGNDVPQWVKNNVKWWCDGQLSNNDLIVGLKEIGIIFVPTYAPIESNEIKHNYDIPNWVKILVELWCQSKITDEEYVGALQYLIDKGYITISYVPTSGNNSELPSWIKTNACWWANGQIDDYSFIQGIQYLIKEGIVVI